jgi:hypothetical protein
MSLIEPLRPEMVTTWLERAGYRYYRPAEGEGFLVLFAPRDATDVGTQVHIETDDDVLSLRVVTDRLFEPHQRARLEALCNQWHQEYRWPMVYVRTRSVGLLGVVAEGHLNTTGSGIHQDLVDKFCSVVVNCSHDFWDWLLRQDLLGLPHEAADIDGGLDRLLDKGSHRDHPSLGDGDPASPPPRATD